MMFYKELDVGRVKPFNAFCSKTLNRNLLIYFHFKKLCGRSRYERDFIKNILLYKFICFNNARGLTSFIKNQDFKMKENYKKLLKME